MAPTLSRSSMMLESSAGLIKLQRSCMAAGISGLLACAVGWFTSPERFFQSYLVGFLFWSGVALGCLAVLMLQHITGGRWGAVIRRIMESGSRTLPLVALMFVPLLFGLKEVYLWARPEVVAADELLQHKAAYLNSGFFTIRAAIYFAIWISISIVLNRWSTQQDESADPGLIRKFQLVSGPGLLIFVLTMTFASVDWVMSLEPHWFSTMYGALFVAGQVLAAMSFGIAVIVLLGSSAPIKKFVAIEQIHDLGKLLMAFVLLWSYFAFSQFLIIWSGNLPEEIPWYLRRLQGGWQWMALALVVLQFALPFMMLLSRKLKRNSSLLSRIAILVIFMRLVDVYWLAAPAFRENLSGFHWLDIAAPVGLGGIWLSLFLHNLKSHPLLPLGDPYIKELVARHGSE